MNKGTVLNELVKLNSGVSDIAYASEHIWHSVKAEYAELIGKLTDFVKTENIRGTVLIATDSDIIWASGSRSKDIDGEIVSPLTTYEIGSVTKSFTATLIMKLDEEGKLSIWDNVTKYFPKYEKAGDMRIFNLLHMSSGIANFSNDPDNKFFGKNEDIRKSFWNGTMPEDDFLEYLYKCDLNFVPGTNFEYSNTNYRVLAMILEMVTDRTYKELMYDTFFTPLGMAATSAGTLGDVTSVPETGIYIPEVFTTKGCGDIHSNVLDLLRFDRAFFAGQIVGEKSLDTMFQFYPYGCGWRGWKRYPGGDYDLICHGGSTISYRCQNFVFCKPEQPRYYLIFMSPCQNDEIDEVFEKLLDVTEPYIRCPIIESEEQKKYAFRFNDENKNRTMDSLRKYPGENAYEITYYGDYALDELLKCGAVDEWAMLEFQTEHLYEGVRNDFFYQYRHNCSGFTARNAVGDFLLCHNLDNPQKLPGVTLAENAVTGKTIGLSNLLYYYRFDTEWEKFDDLSVDKPINRARVLGAPYEMQDGMNAHGLALVTFTASGTEIETDGKKIPLCYYSLNRAIIDRCKTVKEALEFLEHYSMSPADNISHFQIADASGDSAIIEYVGGEMKILRSDKPYQVCSNFLIYGNPEMEGFGKDRYLAYQEYLEAHEGIVDEDTAFRLLHENHIPGDENYSVVFNLTKRTAAVEFSPEFAVRHRYQL
ncbi:MAG: serine hydrolase [Oscillospiraceae bacterium]|nr:serine hydrolase [Oscillospiraceae bacterium]